MTKESTAPVELLGAKSELPPEYMSSLREFWLIISQPRTQTAWLRERYGDLVTTRGGLGSIKGQIWVSALSAEGARQILSADPAGYDPFWTEGFTGLAEMVLHWEFEPVAVERDARHDVAMGPKYGVPLSIKARRSPNGNR